MKIISQTTETLVRTITDIEIEPGTRYTVADYVDEFGKIVDSTYRYADGTEVDDPALIEAIETFSAEA